MDKGSWSSCAGALSIIAESYKELCFVIDCSLYSEYLYQSRTKSCCSGYSAFVVCCNAIVLCSYSCFSTRKKGGDNGFISCLDFLYFGFIDILWPFYLNFFPKK